MSGILVFCRACGKQVASSSTREGLCLDCQVSQALAPLREEHARLWRKRERYRTGGANSDSVSRQLSRLESRMAEKIRELIPSQKEAAERLRQELEAARRSRYEIGR